MIKNICAFLFLAVLIAIEATAQTTGGFPSRPRFQAVTITGDGRLTIAPPAALPFNNASIVMDDSTAAPYFMHTGNAGDWALQACDATLSTCGNIINIPTRASNTTATFLDFTVVTAVRINGTNIELPQTGTLGLQAQGCTTTPTGTATWTRIGKQVTMRVPFLTCTSNATTFRWDIISGSTTGIIPATDLTSFPFTFEDNSAFINSGLAELKNSPFNCFCFTVGGSQTAWTASGRKTFGNANAHEAVFTYNAL